MNVYDFDNTIYDGDSTLDFYCYCLKRKPAVFKYFPKQLLAAFRYKCGKITKTKFKEDFFCFFNAFENIEDDVIKFWDIYEKKIKLWYKKCHKNDDVIITASPEFLIQEICKRLDINTLIASKVNPYDGKYVGNNCYGEEKVSRYYELFPKEKIDQFYSDSISDLPIARISNNSYLVKKNKIEVWKK